MKVICISETNYHGYDHPEVPNPKVGDEVTVTGETVFRGVDCYLLAEYVCPIPFADWLYDKRNFAPLDGLDETELVTEEFKEKYLVPA